MYNKLTDNSSEIECLFIERTKQLLKPNGVAGIILPSSILSNTGIYSKTRELILQYFEIIGITELGSNTFMATGTNTVVLFLRRRDNYFIQNLNIKVERAVADIKDVTINGIEKPLSKYVSHVWEGVSFSDYKTLLKQSPNKKIEQHEIYKEYTKKIKAKNEQDKWKSILALEKDKILYFILALPQKLVLIKTGEKNKEKQFLGYEFSNRRGSEGIHPIQRSKTIDDCTRLYDTETFENPEKASTYIYKAFNGEFDLELPESLQTNISYRNLVDLLTFDRVDFEKNISLSAKKKVKSRWHLVRLGDYTTILSGGTPSKGNIEYWKDGDIPWLKSEVCKEGFVYNSSEFITAKGLEKSSAKYVEKDSTLIALVGATKGRTAFLKLKSTTNQNIAGIKTLSSDLLLDKYIFEILKMLYSYIISNLSQYDMLNLNMLKEFKIPLPPKNIQEKIVSEIEILEKQEQKAFEDIDEQKDNIQSLFSSVKGDLKRLDEVCELKAGKFVKAGDINKSFIASLYPCYGGNGLRGYTETFTNDGQFSLVGRQGALCGNVHLVSGKFHATEHALVAYPKNNVNNTWLHYQLAFMNLNQYATGIAQPGLSVMNLNPIEIPLPPLKEQEKIVAKIEKIENKIAELQKQVELIPNNKEEILKKYLE